MRLNDEKRSLIQIGDTIVFIDTGKLGTLVTKVTGIGRYADFHELYANNDKTELGYDRDLCAESKYCANGGLCVKACPYKAITPGDSSDFEPGTKVIYNSCVVAHEFDAVLDKTWEDHVRRVSARGFAECTKCNLICPYGQKVEKEMIPEKRKNPALNSNDVPLIINRSE